VPGAVVRTLLDQQLTRLEHETGRRPRGKLAREIKEAIVHELLPRAFPKQSTTRIWIDRAAGRVVIGAASAKRADAVLTRLVEQLGGGFRISPVQTALAPATAMAAWLSEKQAPAGFSIDRECELQQPDNDKAAVRYARHTLDIDEVGEHIRHGKLPTQLALTWAGRVSFVLTESLALKKIRWLELALEAGAAAGAGDDGGFDADVALSTGELQRLIPDLLEALGGEAPVDTPAAPAPTPTELRAPLPPPSP
jgi:recombination associated protein RdgC